MQREIKFRGWYEKDKGMMYQDQLNVEHQMIMFWNCVATLPDTIVMQFTGLHDATKWEDLSNEEQSDWINGGGTADSWKGKEIYEGDIVKVSPDSGGRWDTGSVVFGSYAAFCVFLPKIGTGIKSPLLNFCEGTMGAACADVYIEVLGNIYEDPELLTPTRKATV